MSRRQDVLFFVVAATTAVASVSCSNGPWWTSGACPRADEYGSIDRFASDNCIKRLFEPAKLALPEMSNYQHVYWEIERGETTVSVHGQLVPRKRETGVPLIFFASFRDLGYVPDPGTEPEIISIPDTSRRERFSEVCVQFEGNALSTGARWSASAIHYNLEAIGTRGETRSQLEDSLRPIVADLIGYSSRNPAPWPTETGLEDENLRQPAC